MRRTRKELQNLIAKIKQGDKKMNGRYALNGTNFDTIEKTFEYKKDVMRFMYNGTPYTVRELAEKCNKTISQIVYRLANGMSSNAELTKEGKTYVIDDVRYTIKELSDMWMAKWGSKCYGGYSPKCVIYNRIKKFGNGVTLGKLMVFEYKRGR